MSTTHPTSIRLDKTLRRKLDAQAEREGRTRAQHIVHILRQAVASVRVVKELKE